MHVKDEGKDYYVFVRDPEKITEGVDGYTWPGGFFFPSGNFVETLDRTQKEEVGASLIKDSIRLRQVFYSRTKSGRWIANCAFSAETKPIETWVFQETGTLMLFWLMQIH